MQMFSATLISNRVINGDDGRIYHLRPLELRDFNLGLIDVLSQLTVTGNITLQEYKQVFFQMIRNNCYYICVIEDKDSKRIVGTGTLFIEQKFIHRCGRVGHVEEVVVDKSVRGNNLGKYLVTELLHIANLKKCYKVILNCVDKNVPFYEKCGFQERGMEMTRYIHENDKSRQQVTPPEEIFGQQPPVESCGEINPTPIGYSPQNINGSPCVLWNQLSIHSDKA